MEKKRKLNLVKHIYASMEYISKIYILTYKCAIYKYNMLNVYMHDIKYMFIYC